MKTSEKGGRCGHENADHVMPGDRIHFYSWNAASRTALCEQFICLDCGAWLPLGPSADESEAVKIEIRAAALAADLADDDRARWYMDRGAIASDEGHGWFFHNRYITANDGFDAHLLSPEGLAGYLARCIATHDETRRGE